MRGRGGQRYEEVGCSVRYFDLGERNPSQNVRILPRPCAHASRRRPLLIPQKNYNNICMSYTMSLRLIDKSWWCDVLSTAKLDVYAFLA